jgi:type II secretory pathway component PulM
MIWSPRDAQRARIAEEIRELQKKLGRMNGNTKEARQLVADINRLKSLSRRLSWIPGPLPIVRR